MEPESCFDIVAREPVQGGHRSVVKEKLRISATGDGVDGVDGELTVFLKRTSETEVMGLRAVNRVPGASAIPRLIRSGRDSHGHWIAIPFYPGQPAPAETAIPENVAGSLAAMHAHYLDSGAPETIPVIDAESWRAVCELPRLRQLARAGRPALRPIIDRVQSWSAHPVILDMFATLRRTLVHGDVHRNNVLVNDHAGKLVDWEGAQYGLPLLDLVPLGTPGSRGYERYAATWRALTGEDTASPAWRCAYLTATVFHKVRYITFGARHFGYSHATRMLDEATHALAELERTAGG